MKVNFYTYNYTAPPKPLFGSNARTYITEDKNYFGTMTFLLRNDLNWEKLVNCAAQNFRNKEKVNIIQLGASDGSEAYSMIISMLENCPQYAQKFLPIQAYDIDPVIIRAAKSGCINLTKIDLDNLENMTNKWEKYFQKADKPLIIARDYIFESTPDNKSDYAYKTYRANEILTDNVNFHNKDMFDVLWDLEDNSNTILMCRNVMGYYRKKSIDYFLDTASHKLKPGSLFVVGEFDYDTYKTLDQDIEKRDFVEILPYIYQKVE